MIPTVLWELKQRRFIIIWWILGSIILSGLILLLYPPIRDQANQFNKVINQLPSGIRELKTGGSSSINVADPVAFLNSQLFYITLPIPWIILAVTRARGVLGRDEQNHTLELVLARPINRGRLIFAKAASLVVELLVVGGTTLAAIIIMAPFVDLRVSTAGLAWATIYTVLFSLSFGLVAFMLQAVGGLASRIASAVAVFIAFGGYLIASMSGLTSWLTTPSKFAPYHYFAPDKILRGQSVIGLDVYLVGILVLTVVVSYLGFRRRDIA